MRFLTVCVVGLLSGCELAPPSSGDVDAARRLPAKVTAAVQIRCANGACTQLAATAVGQGAVSFEWDYSLNGAVIRTSKSEVVLPLAEGLHTLHLTAIGASGQRAVDAVAISSQKADAYPPPHEIEEAGPGPITILGINNCGWVPVSTIGGCVRGGPDPIIWGMTLGPAAHASQFEIDTRTYSTTLGDEHALWRFDGGPEEFTPGTSASDYGYGVGQYPPLIAAPEDHVTYWFDAQPGTNIVHVGHGLPQLGGAAVYTKDAVEITCSEDGDVIGLASVPLDLAELDHDGDGYPAGQDCDEADPTVWIDCDGRPLREAPR